MIKNYIYAVNVHTGGGLTLLNQLIEHTSEDSLVIVDMRAKNKLQRNKKVQFKFIQPTLFARIAAELWLKKNIASDATVLFFSNLPPIFSFNANKILFLHNILLLSRFNLYEFKWTVRLRIMVERFWLRLFIKNIDEIFVQSSEMLFLSRKILAKPCSLTPFFERPPDDGLHGDDIEIIYDFIYVASGDPHKNHLKLIEAFVMLASDNLRPSLCLTLPEETFMNINSQISTLQRLHNLNISNYTFNNSSKKRAYLSSKALIFPSNQESMGLPLLEAAFFNLDILASEKSYVRDFISPKETFDPDSALSIYRALKRYLVSLDDKIRVLTPSQFLENIFHAR